MRSSSRIRIQEKGEGMYRTYVPVMSGNANICTEELVAELKKANADKILLIAPLVLEDEQALKAKRERLAAETAYFRERGIWVGFWLVPSLGYGSGNAVVQGEKAKSFVKKRLIADTKTMRGTKTEAFCPLDPGFVRAFCECICAYAQIGTELILLEDDLYFGNFDLRETGCCCDLHLRAFAEKTGRLYSPEELCRALYCEGSASVGVRRAWQELKRETMLQFLRSVRAALNEVDARVRLGVSANHVTYDLDGAPLQEMARAAAGKTEPFVRLTGAPYWETARLPSNIECVRLQIHWMRGSGAEMISEGDTFPRPRSRVPAAYLECFDQILRASGGTEGILKYMLDYTSAPLYDPGYLQFHARNRDKYALLDKYFSEKESVGVNVCEFQHLIADRIFDDAEPLEFMALYAHQDAICPPSIVMARDNSLPVSYGVPGYANIIFGENGRHAGEKELRSGAVLDAKAAMLLQERGIDVGFTKAEPAKLPNEEYFYPYADKILVENANWDIPARYYAFTLKEGAKIRSEFRFAASSLSLQVNERAQEKPFPACYTYENASGQRFVVYAFSAFTATPRNVFLPWVTGRFRNIYRQKQLCDLIAWAQRRPLPAVCNGNPDLYILCKKKGENLTVGLWNLYADGIFGAEVLLDGEYTSCEIVGGAGRLAGNKVILESEIRPFEFVILDLQRR